MSHIEKALEKAKKERAGIEVKEKVKDEVKDITYEKPVYQRTRVMPVDENVLLENRILNQSNNSVVTDRYNLLRTKIFERTRDSGMNSILVTSVTKGEGKTLTSINLAISIARELNQTVLLVDADLRSPTVHKILGLQKDKGLSDYLLHDIPISDLLINPGIEKLVILPGGKSIPNSAEILGSPKMETLVQEMKQRYKDRYVIFDSPPLLNSPDPIVFSSYVDGIVLVVEAGKTTTQQITEAMNLLKGKNIIGTVLNKAPIREKDYGY
jgi:exopolysaccharide/PEP-CTERM locus tyrosine autokinase